MAALYGRLRGDGRREVTRTAARVITARLETWFGSVEVVLDRSGAVTVRTGEKTDPRLVVWAGRIES